MAKVATKGTVLKQTISSVLTAVAQVITINTSGAEVETYDATTLDGGAAKEYEPTGYYEPGSVDFEIFYDPALAGHQAITDDITTPTKRAWQITYADTGATTKDFTVAGLGFGETIAMNDGLKASITAKVTGSAGFPT